MIVHQRKLIRTFVKKVHKEKKLCDGNDLPCQVKPTEMRDKTDGYIRNVHEN